MSKSKGKTSAQHTSASENTAMSATLGASAQQESPAQPEGPKRPPRIRMNAGMNLHVPDELVRQLRADGYVPRFFAESSIKGGRVDAAKGAYWEHVTDGSGKNITRRSGIDTMYLMKIEKQWWEEDQKLKKLKVRHTMEKESIVGEGEYAPTPDGRAEGGTHAVTRS